MTPKVHPEKFSIFLACLGVSIAGNLCGDFALIWYASKLVSQQSDLQGGLLSAVYLGQAAGVILLAPFLSAWIDKSDKPKAGRLVDFTYMGVLMLTLAALHADLFSSQIVFILCFFAAGISSAHKSSIAFWGARALGNPKDVAGSVTKLIMVLNGAAIIGSSASGFLFDSLGAAACIVVAIVSFIPILIGYEYFFSDLEMPDVSARRKSISFRSAYIDGFRMIFSNRSLTTMAIFVTATNAFAAIMPGLVTLGYLRDAKALAGGYSWIVGAGIAIGIVSAQRVRRIAEKVPEWAVLGIAFAPVGLSLAWVATDPTPVNLLLMFALNCMGTTLTSIVTGTKRMEVAGSKNIGSVNSAYTVMLFVGQAIGASLVVPNLASSFERTCIAIALTYFVFGIVSAIVLGKSGNENAQIRL